MRIAVEGKKKNFPSDTTYVFFRGYSLHVSEYLINRQAFVKDKQQEQGMSASVVCIPLEFHVMSNVTIKSLW